MSLPTIEPITDETLPEFAAFLAMHMGKARSESDWRAALRHQWDPERTNYGFLLRDSATMVGGIGAIYARRETAKGTIRTCNITSWCVLDAYRQQSTRLLMALIGQEGYHFTNFSPTAVVAGVLRFVKFKPLDGRQAIVPNLPRWARGVRVVAGRANVEALLQGANLRIFHDHREFPRLRHAVLCSGTEVCYVIYRRIRYRGFPAARIVHRSDRIVFERGWATLASHFLSRGMLTTHLDRRMLARLPKLAVTPSWTAIKLYRSDLLDESDIDYLYSESVVLDLD